MMSLFYTLIEVYTNFRTVSHNCLLSRNGGIYHCLTSFSHSLSAILCPFVLTDFADIIAKIAEIARKTISFISTAYWFPLKFFMKNSAISAMRARKIMPLLAL